MFRSLVTIPMIVVLMTSTPADDTSRFKIVTKRDQDRVDVKLDKDRTIFSVHSPTGIGHAVIERIDETWPETVVLRLHLQGLEKFEVTNGKHKLSASVSSQNGKVRQWKNDQENSPLDSRDELWMEIKVIGNDGKETDSIPLKDGCFQVLLPKSCLAGNPKSVTVNWIDFYRN